MRNKIIDSLKTPILSYVYPAIIVFVSSTLLNYWFPISAITWLWLFVGCICTFLLCRNYYKTSIFIASLFYGIVVFLNFIFGDAYYNSFPKVFNELGALFLMPAIAYFCLSKNRKKYSYFIILIFFGVLFITALGTTIVDIGFPGAVRYTVESQNKNRGEDGLLQSFFRFGMENYLLPHALPMLVPIFIMGIKDDLLKFKYRLLFILMLLIVFWLVWLAGSTTALLFTLLFGIFSSFVTIKEKVSISKFLIPLILLLPIVLSQDIQVFFLDILIDFTNISETTHKFASHLADMKYSMLYDSDEGAVGARMTRYEETLNVLTQDLIFGTNSEIGGHAALLDRLATLGLFGIVPLLMFFIHNIKLTKSFLSVRTQTFYLLGTIAGLSMMAVKNMFNVEMLLIMCLILPLVSYVISILEYED